eukprot:SAG22_NODE_714_length_7722_cov_3.919585_3_plen_103_part_00
MIMRRRFALLLALLALQPVAPVFAVHERETGGEWPPDGKITVNSYYTGHMDMLVPCSFTTLGRRCTSAGNHRIVLQVSTAAATTSAAVADLQWRRTGPCVLL